MLQRQAITTVEFTLDDGVKLVNALMQKDAEDYFSAPVCGVPDYYTVVANPMDLSTMCEKAASGNYESVNAVRSDFNLVISNCLQYNEWDTSHAHAARALESAGGSIFAQLGRQTDFVMTSPQGRESQVRMVKTAAGGARSPDMARQLGSNAGRCHRYKVGVLERRLQKVLESMGCASFVTGPARQKGAESSAAVRSGSAKAGSSSASVRSLGRHIWGLLTGALAHAKGNSTDAHTITAGVLKILERVDGFEPIRCITMGADASDGVLEAVKNFLVLVRNPGSGRVETETRNAIQYLLSALVPTVAVDDRQLRSKYVVALGVSDGHILQAAETRRDAEAAAAAKAADPKKATAAARAVLSDVLNRSANSVERWDALLASAVRALWHKPNFLTTPDNDKPPVMVETAPVDGTKCFELHHHRECLMSDVALYELLLQSAEYSEWQDGEQRRMQQLRHGETVEKPTLGFRKFLEFKCKCCKPMSEIECADEFRCSGRNWAKAARGVRAKLRIFDVIDAPGARHCNCGACVARRARGWCWLETTARTLEASMCPKKQVAALRIGNNPDPKCVPWVRGAKCSAGTCAHCGIVAAPRLAGVAAAAALAEHATAAATVAGRRAAVAAAAAAGEEEEEEEEEEGSGGGDDGSAWLAAATAHLLPGTTGAARCSAGAALAAAGAAASAAASAAAAARDVVSAVVGAGLCETAVHGCSEQCVGCDGCDRADESGAVFCVAPLRGLHHVKCPAAAPLLAQQLRAAAVSGKLFRSKQARATAGAAPAPTAAGPGQVARNEAVAAEARLAEAGVMGHRAHFCPMERLLFGLECVSWREYGMVLDNSGNEQRDSVTVRGTYAELLDRLRLGLPTVRKPSKRAAGKRRPR